MKVTQIAKSYLTSRIFLSHHYKGHRVDKRSNIPVRAKQVPFAGAVCLGIVHTDFAHANGGALELPIDSKEPFISSSRNF